MSLSLRRVNVPGRKKRDQREMKLAWKIHAFRALVSDQPPAFLLASRFPPLSLPSSVVPVNFSRFLSLSLPPSRASLYSSRRIDKGFRLCREILLPHNCALRDAISQITVSGKNKRDHAFRVRSRSLKTTQCKLQREYPLRQRYKFQCNF